MQAKYTKCATCGRLIDIEDEAVEYKGKDYCFDHYEEIVQEDQDRGNS